MAKIVKFPHGAVTHVAGQTNYVTACGRYSTAEPKFQWEPTRGPVTCKWCLEHAK
jgi:hypothetical protein